MSISGNQNQEISSGQRRQMQEKFGQSPDQVRREDHETYQSLDEVVSQTAKPGETMPRRDETPIQKPDEKPSTTGNWGEKFRDDETLAQSPGASDQGGGYIRNYSADVDGNKA